MPIKFKLASKKNFANYNRCKYICPACDNEIPFVTNLPSKCSDCLYPIDDDIPSLIRSKDKRLMMHLKLDKSGDD